MLSEWHIEGIISSEEHAYTYAAWKFAFHFLARQSHEFHEVAAALKSDPALSGMFEQIKKGVRKEGKTNIINNQIKIIRIKYKKSIIINKNKNQQFIINKFIFSLYWRTYINNYHWSHSSYQGKNYNNFQV